MKKTILITPLALLLSMFSLNGNLQAAGCSSHKNKNVKVECPLSDNKCDSNKADDKLKSIEV